MNELPEHADASTGDVEAAGVAMEMDLSTLVAKRERKRADDRLTDDIETAFHRYWEAVMPGRRCRVMVGRHPDAPIGATLAAWAEPADDLDETSPEGLFDESRPDHYPDSIS